MQNYINPIELLNLDNALSSGVDGQAILKAKKTLLAEIELSDTNTIIHNGIELTKSDCIRAIDDLDHKDKRDFHLFIFENTNLNNFLTSGNINFFKSFRAESIYKLPAFIDFISPYFSIQYAKALSRNFKGNNFNNVKVLLTIKPLVNDQYMEDCYKATYATLKDIENEIIKITKDIEFKKSEHIENNFSELPKLINQKVNVDLINLLPSYFQSLRNQFAQSVRNLARNINNDPYNVYKPSFEIIEIANAIQTDGLAKQTITKGFYIIKKNYEDSIPQTVKYSNQQTTPPKVVEVEIEDEEDAEKDKKDRKSRFGLLHYIAGATIIAFIATILITQNNNPSNSSVVVEKKLTDDDYFQKGSTYFRQSNFTDAIIQFDKVINLNPNYTIAYLDRGASKTNLGQYEGAIIDYQKAEELGLKTSILYSNWGYAYYKLKQPVKALTYLEKAIEIDPNNGNAYRFRGEIKYDKNDNKGAVQDYTKAISSNANASNYFSRGLAYYYLKDYKKAIQDMNKAIQLNPNAAQYYFDRGDAKDMINDFDGACRDWKIAKEKGYNVPDYKINRCTPQIVYVSNGELLGCNEITPKYNKGLDNKLLITVGSNASVAVKLINISNNKCIRYVFINKNTNYSIRNIPEGRYYLKIAYGEDWSIMSGQPYCTGRFTKNTLFEKGEDILNYNLVYSGNGYKVPSFSLKLDVIITEDGMNSFNTDKINENDFYNEQ
jgi:tetratricopeptide (TPR) repeat protein